MIIDLVLFAIIGYVGYNGYKTYTANGNSVSPIDTFVSAFVKNLLRQK